MLSTTISPPERDRWFAGTLLRIIADSTDTNGALTVMEQRARRGFSPPMHRHHREDTALLMLEGRLTVRVDGEDSVLRPGQFIWLPRDRPHSFRVDSDEAHFFELATPGGVEGFHIDASDVASSTSLPANSEPDVPRMVAAVGAYSIEIVGPPMNS